MKSLSTTTMVATAVHNHSVSELHVGKARDQPTKDRNSGYQGQSKCKSSYHYGATPSHPKKECSAKDGEYYKCWEEGMFQE